MTVELEQILANPHPVDGCVDSVEAGAMLFLLADTDSFVLESEEARRWCNGMWCNGWWCNGW